jgi:exopolyphosphatase/guanosine-5'-triphosphate,3'-diphosphate pyrophosphatase
MIAIDLGSNSIGFIAVDSDGAELWEAQYTVRTAEGLVRTGEIKRSALERISAAIKVAKSEFDFRGHAIKAVATAAFREAKNRDAALKFLLEKCGISFEVISCEKEAALTAMAAAKSAVSYGLKEPLYVLDIGGASTEIIYFDKEPKAFYSLNMGIVTLSEGSLDDDEMTFFIERKLEELNGFYSLRLPKPECIVAVAGVPTTLGAIKKGLTFDTYDKREVNGTMLSTGEIEKYQTYLRNMDSAALDRIAGEGRGALIICGAQILSMILRKTVIESCSVFDEGLRYGLLMVE